MVSLGPAWLVVSVYAWYFLLLAAFQRRFVGELAPFFAVLAGYAFVVLAAKLDVTAPPAIGRDNNTSGKGALTNQPFGIPDRNTITAIALLFLFVTSAGVVQTAVRHEQVKIDGDSFEAAVWIDDYADGQGWEYPDNYVLSKWGRNRMYNYFVSGESKSYRFAKGNYESFLSSQDPKSEYHKLNDKVRFVITKDLNLHYEAPRETNYARLHHRFGSVGPSGASGAGHYRAVYVSDDGSVKVFTLVPGANITGTAPANSTVTVSKRVEIESTTFEYRRMVEVGADGNFSVTVPYPGTYKVGDQTVTVTESTVRNGGNVTVGT